MLSYGYWDILENSVVSLDPLTFLRVSKVVSSFLPETSSETLWSYLDKPLKLSFQQVSILAELLLETYTLLTYPKLKCLFNILSRKFKWFIAFSRSWTIPPIIEEWLCTLFCSIWLMWSSSVLIILWWSCGYSTALLKFFNILNTPSSELWSLIIACKI